VHVLQWSTEVEQIVKMAAIAVVDAQETEAQRQAAEDASKGRADLIGV
jgi:hypothetical protein